MDERPAKPFLLPYEQGADAYQMTPKQFAHACRRPENKMPRLVVINGRKYVVAAELEKCIAVQSAEEWFGNRVDAMTTIAKGKPVPARPKPRKPTAPKPAPKGKRPAVRRAGGRRNG